MSQIVVEPPHPAPASSFLLPRHLERFYALRVSLQVEYVEDLEEDESDIEDTAEWGGSYWGGPGSAAGGARGAGARRGDSDSEGHEEDDDGEITCCCCFHRWLMFVGVRPLHKKQEDNRP